MKVLRFALRSLNDGVSHRFHQPHSVRALSTYGPPGGRMDEKGNSNPFESTDDLEARIFSENSEGDAKTDAFFAKLDRLSKTRDGHADEKQNFNSFGSSYDFKRTILSKTSGGNSKTDAFSANFDTYASNLPGGNGSGSHVLDDLDESFNTLSDGVDGKLKSAAKYFEYDSEEVERDDFTYRPDARFQFGGTYEVKDIDLTRSANPRPPKRNEFEVTTKEVLQQADFRNVRFLANFITEAGVIIKRSQTKISAKAQRKVAREIKTARAFGLMPFTTMGTKSFVVGKTMEAREEDFEYESFDNPTADDSLGY